MSEPGGIRTPDQRLRVFVSSTLGELADERQAVRSAVSQLRLMPVMFEAGARPHPPRDVYRAYLAQSDIFIGVYWQEYGWIAAGEEISGLEDEYELSAGLPRLIYVKWPAPARDPKLAAMLGRIRDEAGVSYQRFADPGELQRLVENDLAVLLSERFEITGRGGAAATAAEPAAGTALPVPATPIVGRDREIARGAELLQHGARLITFTGPGGVGKSRLALEVANRAAGRFRDGVRFVGLASVSSADLVPPAVASALGLNSLGERLKSDVISYLQGKQIVLLFDNFEQVADAAPLVTELLAAAPGLVALVTSRAALRLNGEHEFPVSPLPVPLAGTEGAAHDPLQYPSILLFAERARAVAPGFELTDANADSVIQICQRLDGLPLAIELAAARIKILSPGALLARLNDRMRLLTGGPRDLPERQRTLRSTLDWSYDLLPEGERALLARLGTFSGTFDLPAVEVICGQANEAGPPAPAQDGHVVDMLDSLVENSLVVPGADGDEPRFRLLETVADYALERLRERGEWAQMHDRHAAYFLAFARPTESERYGVAQLKWLDRLEAERRNIGSALAWLTDNDQFASAVTLAWTTFRFWWLRGRAWDFYQYVEDFPARSDALPPDQRALVLRGVGYVLIAGSGDRARARSLFERSLALFRQTGNTVDGVLAAAALGHVLGVDGECPRAVELLKDGLGQLEEIAAGALAGSRRGDYLLAVAMVNNYLGQIELAQKDPESAAAHLAAGLTAARSAPDHFIMIITLFDVAAGRLAQDDLAGASDSLAEGLSLAAKVGDEPSTAYYLEASADLARRRDNAERAVCLLTAADALLQAKGSGWLHAYVTRAPHGADVLAKLRAATTVQAFERARAHGRSLADTGVLGSDLERLVGTGR
jgi:predicted ATPase